MRPLSARELLDAWERGARGTAAERAVVLLEAAGSGGDAAALPVGRRDAALLDLREMTFGARCEAVVDCAACGEPLELAFGLDDVRAEPPGGGGEADGPGAEELAVTAGGREVRFRLPDTRDLLASIAPGDAEASRRRLLERCVLDPEGATGLDDEQSAAVVEGMAAADPQADVELELECPSCGARHRETFDIASFMWSEVEASAARLLGEVHQLALAYGWREPDVLALTPARRRFYLEAIGA
ncbi:MAG TPA: hypothetical protein VF520_12870 [Thermoleophilaceae bacterium]